MFTLKQSPRTLYLSRGALPFLETALTSAGFKRPGSSTNPNGYTTRYVGDRMWSDRFVSPPNPKLSKKFQISFDPNVENLRLSLDIAKECNGVGTVDFVAMQVSLDFVNSYPTAALILDHYGLPQGPLSILPFPLSFDSLKLIRKLLGIDFTLKEPLDAIKLFQYVSRSQVTFERPLLLGGLDLAPYCAPNVALLSTDPHLFVDNLIIAAHSIAVAVANLESKKVVSKAGTAYLELERLKRAEMGLSKKSPASVYVALEEKVNAGIDFIRNSQLLRVASALFIDRVNPPVF
ncbi:hypothetical protein HY988_01355 [Candidatus Micrarchaeota archaeon]|nr:hypothetical protein [Candidatus Micrarchaeota archaeon]